MSWADNSLTTPLDPTGIKQGVRMRPRAVSTHPARASPSMASIWNWPSASGGGSGPRSWRHRRTGTYSPSPGPPCTVAASGALRRPPASRATCSSVGGSSSSARRRPRNGGPAVCTAGSCLRGHPVAATDSSARTVVVPTATTRLARWQASQVKAAPSTARRASCAPRPGSSFMGRNVPSPTARSTWATVTPPAHAGIEHSVLSGADRPLVRPRSRPDLRTRSDSGSRRPTVL